MCALVTGVQTCALPISVRKAIVERGVDVATAVIDACRRSKSPAAICLERISADTRNDELILATGDLSPTSESHKVAARQPDVRHLVAVAARIVVRKDVDRKSTRLNSSH